MAASEGLFSFILQENWLRRIFCRSLVLPFAHTDPKQRFSVMPCVFVWNGSKPPVLQKHVLQSDQKMTFCKRARWKRRNARRARSIRVSMWLEDTLITDVALHVPCFYDFTCASHTLDPSSRWSVQSDLRDDSLHLNSTCQTCQSRNEIQCFPFPPFLKSKEKTAKLWNQALKCLSRWNWGNR